MTRCLYTGVNCGRLQPCLPTVWPQLCNTECIHHARPELCQCGGQRWPLGSIIAAWEAPKSSCCQIHLADKEVQLKVCSPLRDFLHVVVFLTRWKPNMVRETVYRLRSLLFSCRLQVTVAIFFLFYLFVKYLCQLALELFCFQMSRQQYTGKWFVLFIFGQGCNVPEFLSFIEADLLAGIGHIWAFASCNLSATLNLCNMRHLLCCCSIDCFMILGQEQ